MTRSSSPHLLLGGHVPLGFISLSFLIALSLSFLPSVQSTPTPTPATTSNPPLPTTYEELLSLLSSKDHPGILPGAQEAGVLASLTRDKWIGIGLAVSSSLAIGISSIITKKGLIDAAERGNGVASDDHSYLANPIWWAGMGTMIVGEVANFAAYTFAPPILVTPLGALSVLIGAILASFVLKEELGRLGRIGCTLCLVGTVIIVLNAPEDKEIQTVDEILNYAIQPAFLSYCFFVFVFAVFAIYKVSPVWGKRTPLVYISICSLVGSISVMSVKGFGVALKLTFDGNNQFTHPSTYCFAIVVVVCILVQMNYFNKALDQFSTNVVNPIYFVMFTTATIVASFLLFSGFNTEGAGPAVTLLGGFVVIFTGVYLLNLNRLVDPVTQQPRMSLMTGEGVANTGRLSFSQDSLGQNRGLPMSGINRGGHGRRNSRRDSSSSSVLFNAYENEESVGLTQLQESDDESEDAMSPALGRGDYNQNQQHYPNNKNYHPPPSRPLSAGSNRYQASSPLNSSFVNATSPLPDRLSHNTSPNFNIQGQHNRTGSLKAARASTAKALKNQNFKSQSPVGSVGRNEGRNPQRDQYDHGSAGRDENEKGTNGNGRNDEEAGQDG